MNLNSIYIENFICIPLIGRWHFSLHISMPLSLSLILSLHSLAFSTNWFNLRNEIPCFDFRFEWNAHFDIKFDLNCDCSRHPHRLIKIYFHFATIKLKRLDNCAKCTHASFLIPLSLRDNCILNTQLMQYEKSPCLRVACANTRFLFIHFNFSSH